MYHRHKMFLITLFAHLVALAVFECSAVQYSDCGSSNAGIHSIDISPMPIRYPGTVNISLLHSLKRPTNSFTLSVNIMRTVSGIRLPVSCYMYGGVSVGSCRYTGDQICDLIKVWWPKTFGLYLASLVSTILGNDCGAYLQPTSVGKTVQYSETIELPNLSGTLISFLMSGDFEVKLLAVEKDTQAFCGIFKYSIK